MINTNPFLSAAAQQQLKKTPLCANSSIYISAAGAKMKIIQLYVSQNFLQLKTYFFFFEALAVPLSLPIWLPPSCSLADSVFCHQRGGSHRSLRSPALFPSVGPAGLRGHGLASLTLIYFYGIQSECRGFMPLRRTAKFNSSGRECWKGFGSLGNVFCRPR